MGKSKSCLSRGISSPFRQYCYISVSVSLSLFLRLRSVIPFQHFDTFRSSCSTLSNGRLRASEPLSHYTPHKPASIQQAIRGPEVTKTHDSDSSENLSPDYPCRGRVQSPFLSSPSAKLHGQFWGHSPMQGTQQGNLNRIQYGRDSHSIDSGLILFLWFS